MFVERVSITNDAPAISYTYGDFSGSWESIIVEPPTSVGPGRPRVVAVAEPLPDDDDDEPAHREDVNALAEPEDANVLTQQDDIDELAQPEDVGALGQPQEIDESAQPEVVEVELLQDGDDDLQGVDDTATARRW